MKEIKIMQINIEIYEDDKSENVCNMVSDVFDAVNNNVFSIKSINFGEKEIFDMKKGFSCKMENINN